MVINQNFVDENRQMTYSKQSRNENDIFEHFWNVVWFFFIFQTYVSPPKKTTFAKKQTYVYYLRDVGNVRDVRLYVRHVHPKNAQK